MLSAPCLDPILSLWELEEGLDCILDPMLSLWELEEGLDCILRRDTGVFLWCEVEPTAVDYSAPLLPSVLEGC